MYKQWLFTHCVTTPVCYEDLWFLLSSVPAGLKPPNPGAGWPLLLVFRWWLSAVGRDQWASECLVEPRSAQGLGNECCGTHRFILIF